jgi:hypothetical protein
VTRSPAKWPSRERLIRLGFKPCWGSPKCRVFVDPANRESGLCGRHERKLINPGDPRKTL